MPSPPATSLRRSLRPAPRDRAALIALGIGSILAAVVAGLATWPVRRQAAGPWLEDPWSTAQVAASGSSPMIHSALRPLGELIGAAGHGARHDLLGALLMVACGTVAASLAHAFYRGSGREIAAITAAPLSVAVLARWLQGGPPLGALVFTLLALLSVRALVRPLVQLGRVTPVAAGRALAGAGTCCLLDTMAGLAFALLVAVVCVFRRQRIQPSDPGATMRGLIYPGARTEILRWGPAFAIGLGFPLVAALGVSGSGLGLQSRGVGNLTIAAPPIGELRQYLGLPALFPALALVVLLLLPLRWRGGPTVTVLLGCALVVQNDGHPLCPVPVLLVALVVAACGWAWLAGTAVKSAWLGRALATCSAGIVVFLALFADSGSDRASMTPTPLAEARPSRALAGAQLRALVAPGDVLLVHDPITFAELRALQTRDGVRPDLTLIDARAAEPDALALLAMSFAAEGQRVLSDSFDLAGRWPRDWAVDAGPFFWFTFRPVRSVDVIALDSLALLEHDGRLDERERSRWVRMHIERARHRRALGQHTDAAAALPLPASERARLASDVRVAQALRVSAVGSTRLHRLDPAHEAAALAEAGDLLFETGQLERGHELLSEAAQAGNASAWGALCRWELDAGEDHRAQLLFEALEDQPELDGEALETAWWLIDHERNAEAARLLASTPAARSQAPYDQIAIRLRLLRPE